MKKIVYLVLILFVFSSCQNSNSEKPIIAKTPFKTYTFKLDFINYRASYGRFLKNETPLFYFYHHIYSDHIIIYNEQQEKIDSVSLTDYTTNINPVVSVDFLNSDTISLRTKRDVIYLINSEAELLKTISTSMIQNQLNDSLLEIYNKISYSDKYQGALISNYNDKGNPYGLNDYCDYIRYYMEKDVNTERLVLIDNVFADSLNIHHFIQNLEKQIIDSSYFASIMYKTYFVNDALLMYESFTAKLYQISLQNRKIEKTVNIKSKYPGAITQPLIDLNSNHKDCFEKMKRYGHGNDYGQILSVYFSNYTQMYYVAVGHTKKTDSDKEKRYSIIAYDKEFNRIGESELLLSTPRLWADKGVFLRVETPDDDKQIKLEYYEFIK